MNGWALLCGLALGGCALVTEPGPEIEWVWWGPDRRLSLVAHEPEPSASSFAIIDDWGVRAASLARCRNERCLVRFAHVGIPIALAYDRRRTPIRTCSRDARFGLCPFGQTCVDGECQDLCSPSHLEGVCLEDGAHCIDGGCAYPDGPLTP